MARNARALTLAELLVAVSITAMIGLSAVTMGSMLTSNYSQTEAYYEAVQTARVAMMRVQSQFRCAQLVTQISPSQIILWREANNADGQINPSELVLLTYSGGTITQYQIVYPANFPAFLLSLLNAPTTLANVMANPSSWASTIQNNWYTTSSVLATGVTSLSVSPDAIAPMTREVSITLSTGQAASSFTLRGSAFLRADRTSDVALVGGQYALVGF